MANLQTSIQTLFNNNLSLELQRALHTFKMQILTLKGLVDYHQAEDDSDYSDDLEQQEPSFKIFKFQDLIENSVTQISE